MSEQEPHPADKLLDRPSGSLDHPYKTDPNLLMILGILGIVVQIVGPIALYFYKQHMDECAELGVEPHPNAQIALIGGIIGSVILLIFLMIFLIYVIFIVLIVVFYIVFILIYVFFIMFLVCLGGLGSL